MKHLLTRTVVGEGEVRLGEKRIRVREEGRLNKKKRRKKTEAKRGSKWEKKEEGRGVWTEGERRRRKSKK